MANGNGNGNGACDCDEWAAKVQRAARYQLRQLRNDGNDPLAANWLMGGIHFLQLVLDGPLDQRVIAPLVRPAPTECAWPPQPCEA